MSAFGADWVGVATFYFHSESGLASMAGMTYHLEFFLEGIHEHALRLVAKPLAICSTSQ